MRIGLIGVSWPTSGLLTTHQVESVNFASRQNFVDFDMIIWDPLDLFAHYPLEHRTNTMDQTHYDRMKRDMRQHYSEIETMVAQGKMIVIFLPPPKNFQYDHSGEYGRGARSSSTLTAQLPYIHSISLEEAEGDTVKVNTDSEALKEFSNNVKKYVSYRSFLLNSLGQPFLYSSHEKVIGSILPVETGNVLLCPRLLITDRSPAQDTSLIIDELVKLAASVRNESSPPTLPNWANDYFLVGEKEIRDEKKRLEAEKIELESKIEKAQLSLNDFDRLKTLFAAGTGLSLGKLCIEVLNEIGFSAIEGPEGRDDIILTFNEKPAVAEVKGKTKSAAEKDAAQLEKWVSGYFAQHGEEPKGILIVNAYKDIPLDERSDPAFNPQMLDYCIRKGLCLITTTQLLELLQYVRANPEEKNRVAEAILTTTGEFNGLEKERTGSIMKSEQH